MIELDVAARRIDLDLSEEELATRKVNLTHPPVLMARGYQKLYLDIILQANPGANLNFLVDSRGIAPSERRGYHVECLFHPVFSLRQVEMGNVRTRRKAHSSNELFAIGKLTSRQRIALGGIGLLATMETGRFCRGTRKGPSPASMRLSLPARSSLNGYLDVSASKNGPHGSLQIWPSLYSGTPRVTGSKRLSSVDFGLY